MFALSANNPHMLRIIIRVPLLPCPFEALHFKKDEAYIKNQKMASINPDGNLAAFGNMTISDDNPATMITLTTSADFRLKMTFPYNENNVAFVKETFTEWQYDNPTFSLLVPHTNENIEKIRDHADRFNKAEAALKEHSRRVAAMNAKSAYEMWQLCSKWSGNLQLYTDVGVKLITRYTTGKAYISHKMEKDIALAVIHQLRAYPALVVCPAGSKDGLGEQASKFLFDKRVQVIEKGEDQVDSKADIVVVSYNSALKVAKDESFNMVVFDELSYLKTPGADRTKAVGAIAKLAPRRLMLSGTAITNNPSEQFEIIDVTDEVDLSSFRQFVNEYFGKYDGEYVFVADDATDIDVLNQQFRDRLSRKNN